MMDLFCDQSPENDKQAGYRPLAARVRPKTLAEYVGQSLLVGNRGLLIIDK